MVGQAGRNGAGKTTSLRTISGLVTPKLGTIRFRDEALAREPERVVRAGVAHVPEGRRVFANLSVEDNLRSRADWRHDRTY